MRCDPSRPTELKHLPNCVGGHEKGLCRRLANCEFDHRPAQNPSRRMRAAAHSTSQRPTRVAIGAGRYFGASTLDCPYHAEGQLGSVRNGEAQCGAPAEVHGSGKDGASTPYP
jgi:hypothetical protein